MCCVIKVLIGWYVGEVVFVCWERCGGQGYFFCNKFGLVIGYVYVVMIVEGDNFVLMQKVVIEWFMLFKLFKVKVEVGIVELDSIECLYRLFEVCE